MRASEMEKREDAGPADKAELQGRPRGGSLARPGAWGEKEPLNCFESTPGLKARVPAATLCFRLSSPDRHFQQNCSLCGWHFRLGSGLLGFHFCSLLTSCVTLSKCLNHSVL